jgi:hypothetical protein
LRLERTIPNVLLHSTVPLGVFGGHKNANLGQELFQILTAVGQVFQEPPRCALSQSRLGKQFLSQGDVHYVGGGELVEEGHLTSCTKQVQLYAVNAERTLPYPTGSRKACRLRNLAWMQDFQQRRINKQDLRLTYELRENLPSQRLQKASELPYAPSKKGCSLSTHLNCWKSARTVSSESERHFMDSWRRAP